MNPSPFQKIFQQAVRSAFFLSLLSSSSFCFGKEAEKPPLDKSMRSYRLQASAKNQPEDK